MLFTRRWLLLPAIALTLLCLWGCSGSGKRGASSLEYLPDFKFTKMNGHPLEKLNLELDEGKRFLVLYFSRAYLRG